MKNFGKFCFILCFFMVLGGCEKKIAEPTDAEILTAMNGQIAQLKDNMVNGFVSTLIPDDSFKIENMKLQKLGCQNIQTGIFQCVVNVSFVLYLPLGLQQPLSQQLSLKLFKTNDGWAIIN